MMPIRAAVLDMAAIHIVISRDSGRLDWWILRIGHQDRQLERP